MSSAPFSAVLMCAVLVNQLSFDTVEVRSIASVRDEIRAAYQQHRPIGLELVDAEHIVGTVGKISLRKFEMVDKQGCLIREVSYKEVHALLDPSTGQIIAITRRTWIDRHPGRFLGLVAAATGVLVVIYVVRHVPRT